MKTIIILFLSGVCCFGALGRSGNIALGSISSMVINDGKYNAFPGLCRLPNGNLFVIYRKGTDHAISVDGAFYSRVSTNSGVTWEAETFVYKPVAKDIRDAEVILLPNGRLLVSLFMPSSPLSYAAFTMFGLPNGNSVTWNAPVQAPTIWNQIQATSGKILLLSNGTLVFPTYGNNAGTNASASVILGTFSSSNSITWGTEKVVVGADAINQYDEWNCVQLASGQIVGMIRHDIGGTVGYLKATSDDNGVTWACPLTNNISTGVGRPTVCLLPSGGIFYSSGWFIAPSTNWTAYNTTWDTMATWQGYVGEGTLGLVRAYGSATLLDTGYLGHIFAQELNSTNAFILYQNFVDKYSIYPIISAQHGFIGIGGTKTP